MIDNELESSGDTGHRLQGNGRSQNNDHNLSSRSNERHTPDSQSLPDDDSDIGDALRTIYQQTVDEDIPSEMLDLLKRLD